MNYDDDYYTPPLNRAFSSFCRKLFLAIIISATIIGLAVHAARSTLHQNQTHPTMTVEDRK